MHALWINQLVFSITLFFTYFIFFSDLNFDRCTTKIFTSIIDIMYTTEFICSFLIGAVQSSYMLSNKAK